MARNRARGQCQQRFSNQYQSVVYSPALRPPVRRFRPARPPCSGTAAVVLHAVRRPRAVSGHGGPAPAPQVGAAAGCVTLVPDICC